MTTWPAIASGPTSPRRSWQFPPPCTRTAVGQLERGERVARVDTVVKLAGSLGIPPEELLDGMSWEPGGTRLGRFTKY